MIHWIDPILPEVFLTPDHNQADTAQATLEALERQRMVKGFFEGSIDGDVVDDCLAEHGINPHAFWVQAEENIEEFILMDPQEIEGLDRLLRHGPYLGS